MAFSKPQPSGPGELTYQAEVSTSTGADFGAAQQVFEGNQIELASSAAGDVLLVGVATLAVATLHAARLDSEGRWQVFPDYVCHGSTCDVRFGISNGADTILLIERTAGAMYVNALADGEIREERVIEHSEVADPIVSHALDVTESGEAMLVWLTPRAIHASRLTLDHGWSDAVVLQRLDLELESSWDAREINSSPCAWTDYPMQAKRLPDGRELIVWSQYDDLVTKMDSDTTYRQATSSSAWSLLVDGGSNRLERLSGR